MSTLRQTIRFVIRNIMANPGFSFLAIGILAIGIGSSTAIFSVVHGILFRSLPYEQPNRIVRVWADRHGEGDNQATLRVVEVQALERQATSFAKVGAQFPTDVTLIDASGDALRIPAAMINAEYFDVFGIQPAIGRFLSSEEVESGADLVAVVSHAFWVLRLGGEESAIGRSVILDGNAFTIVGVLPSSFQSPAGDADVYVPYSIGTDGWIGRWLNTYATLTPGATRIQATAELNGLMRNMWSAERRTDGWTLSLVSLTEDLLGDVRTTLLLLLASVTVVLLIACANVANLLLARATTREREIAVRMALGAGRAELIRTVLAESVSMSLLGGALGVVLAFVGVEWLITIAPADIPRVNEIAVNGSVLAVAAGASVLAGVLAGTIPAIYAARRYPGAALTGHGRGSSQNHRTQRILGGLVVAEIALTLMLLATAGLVMRSFAAVRGQDTGFSLETVVAMELLPPSTKYGEPEQIISYYRDVAAQVDALPDVTAAGVGSHLPLTGRDSWMAVNSERRWNGGNDERVPALQRVAHPSFFAALDIPLLDGRFFDSRDVAGVSDRVIINRTLAERFWPGEIAVGKRLTTSREPDAESWIEVVGVVGDVKYQTMEADAEPQVYQPHPQQTWRAMFLFARGSGDADAMIASVRRTIRSVDPSVRVANETSLKTVTNAAVAGRRFSVWLFGVFGLVALTLAIAGVYGTLTFAVSRRTREMGIRIALGAKKENLIRLVLSRGLVLLGLGCGIGVVLAIVAGQSVRSLLFGVEPNDLVTLMGVITVLAVTVVFASLAPAFRAARVNPITVLRVE